VSHAIFILSILDLLRALRQTDPRLARAQIDLADAARNAVSRVMYLSDIIIAILPSLMDYFDRVCLTRCTTLLMFILFSALRCGAEFASTRRVRAR